MHIFGKCSPLGLAKGLSLQLLRERNYQKATAKPLPEHKVENSTSRTDVIQIHRAKDKIPLSKGKWFLDAGVYAQSQVERVSFCKNLFENLHRA
jgi:hypothetical protein